HRRRHGGQSGLYGRVAADLLEEDDEEEEEDREPRVHRERLEVPEREVAVAEEVEPQHRMRGARFVDEKAGERRDAAEHRRPDRRAAPAVHRLLDQRERDAEQPERTQSRAEEVDWTTH